jgi:hypothetical protein
MEPRITSIRFYSGPVRREPKLGDYRVTKKHGEQIRIFSMVRHHITGKIIGYDCTGGRQRYEWVSLEEAFKQHPYLKDKYEAGKLHRIGK